MGKTTAKVTVKVTHTIDHERLECLLISAFEGGSNYWIQKARSVNGGDEYEQAFDYGVRIWVSAERGDPFSGKSFLLNLTAMEKGLQVMADKFPHHMADILAENDDATTGDVFLQLCLFGEVVYG